MSNCCLDSLRSFDSSLSLGNTDNDSILVTSSDLEISSTEDVKIDDISSFDFCSLDFSSREFSDDFPNSFVILFNVSLVIKFLSF